MSRDGVLTAHTKKKHINRHMIKYESFALEFALEYLIEFVPFHPVHSSL